MSAANRPARLNRTLVALLGVVLLGVGGVAALAYVDRPDVALLPPLGPVPPWAPVAVGAAGVVVGLLSIRWLLAQFARGPKIHLWRSVEETGATRFTPSIAITPFTEEVAALPAVRSASATLGGTRDAPTLAVVITAEPRSDLREIRRSLATETVPRLRQALDLETLPVTVEFRFSTTSVRVS